MRREAAYLLDSHALLWWWLDPDRLSTAERELLTNPAMPVLVSAATVWELSFKHHQGKLPELSGAIADLPGLLQADGFEALPISLAHGLRAGAHCRPGPRRRWRRRALPAAMASRWSHANAIRIEDPQLLRQEPTFRRLDAR